MKQREVFADFLPLRFLGSLRWLLHNLPQRWFFTKATADLQNSMRRLGAVFIGQLRKRSRFQVLELSKACGPSYQSPGNSKDGHTHEQLKKIFLQKIGKPTRGFMHSFSDQIKGNCGHLLYLQGEMMSGMLATFNSEFYAQRRYVWLTFFAMGGPSFIHFGNKMPSYFWATTNLSWDDSIKTSWGGFFGGPKRGGVINSCFWFP